MLTFLLFALPLAACAMSPEAYEASLPAGKSASPLRQKQIAEAQTNCEGHDIEPFMGSTYWHCVNAYLWPRYRWQAALNPDGSLHVIVHRAGYQPGYFF